MMSVEQVALNRAQRHKLQTRERLMDATDALLYAHGYSALTVRRITNEADLGHGTFYLHFANLDDAVWAVIERRADAVNSAMIAQLAAEPARRRAYLSWVQILSVVRETPDLFLEMFGKNGSAHLIQAYQNWLATIHEVNMQGGAYEPRPDLPIAFQAQYMAGATLRILCWWAETGFEQTPEAMAGMLYHMAYGEALAANQTG